jgi:hypothetical protein
MGGYDGGSFLKSAEMYDTSDPIDPIAGQWRKLPSMSSARAFCGVVACDM